MPASSIEPSLRDGLLSDRGEPSSEPTLSDALAVCRKLRTKFAFLPLVSADNEPVYWQTGDGSTAVHWCLRTMECAGPDGGLVHASLCRSERACYACHGE
jgi:hypothetical protein